MASDDEGGFNNFCGGRFWDTNLTWSTNRPDFTPCFQKSVLVWAPCAFLWICLPFYGKVLHSLPKMVIPLNSFNIAKTIVSIFMALVLWVELLFALGDLAAGKTLPLIDYVTPSVHMVTYIALTCLMSVERLKGFVTSGVVWIFLFLETVTGIIPFYSKILAVMDNDGVVADVPRFVLFYLYYACTLTLFILASFADKPPRSMVYDQPYICPELTSSFPGLLTFWWLNGLVWTSFRKELVEEDVFPLNPRDVGGKSAPVFRKAWEAEVARKRKNRPRQVHVTKQRHSSAGRESSERTPLIPRTSDPEVEVRTGKSESKPSIMWVLTKTYAPTLMLSWACKVVYDVLQFVSPQLLSLLIEFAGDERIEVWKGYLYAAMFFVVAASQSVFFHQLFHIGMTLGMRIKSALIAAIYRKALTMSNDARKHATVGEIVNLMSVDAQRIQDVTGYLWMLFSAPFQICVAVWLLWNELGAAVLAGVAIMILLIPVNGVIAGISRKLQIQQMKFKDARIKLMNELLNGVKVLKLYAWEESFQAKVEGIRNNELKTLRKAAYLSAIATFTWTCAPFIVTLASFTVFVLTSGEALTSRKAFTSLSLFNILRFPMNLLPMLVTYVITASVSVKRISEFLQNKDLDEDCISHDPSVKDPIVIENGTFNWGEGAVLKDVNIKIPQGKLVAVVGAVGAGKSSLLGAMLGEMEKERGRVNTRGSIAYVAQQAWIQNMTLRDNVLFGKDFLTEKYERIIESCALGPDLKILPGGDETEIGEKGINLSGGQKQRVSLARAVYCDADVYLLDDPLSAVDSHVGKHIFERVIGQDGLLQEKTRVLVTHGLHWLPYVDHVIVIDNGIVTEQGTFDELLSHQGPFASLIKQHLTQEQGEEDEDEEIQELKKNILQRAVSVTSDGEDDDDVPMPPPDVLRRKLSSPSKQELLRAISKEEVPLEPKKKEAGKEKLIEDEKREVGKVKLSVILTYITALRPHYVIPFLFLFVCYWVANIFSSIWLSKWSTDTLLNNASVPVNSTEYVNRRDYYLGIYGGLGVGQAVFILFYSLGLALCMILASRRLHEGMLGNILKAPMSFFDTTPIGRIVNRFSRDIETIDTILPGTFRSYLSTLFTVISTVVIIIYSTWYFIALIIPLAILYWIVQRVYIPTSRQLKRIESTTRSPIYVHFSETLTGVQTIRAYGYQDEFMNENLDKVDKNLKYYFASIASNRWLGYRLELIGSFVTLGAALFAVAGRGQPGWEGIVGLSVSYALQVTGALNYMVRMSSDLETNVVSVERVIEYSETENEAEWEKEGTGLEASWPDQGNINFSNYSVRYREGLDLVLNNVSFQIFAGEKIGIVGRTGAGKSSLTLSLFRIIEAAAGQVLIDGIDISTLGLHQLRKKITILPQDPVLFSGSMRMNLDPFEEYSDAKIWTALQSAHLHAFVSSKPEGLSYECGEGGQNLSVGQRQLVCLARALLRKTKILVLDEATAAVDVQTDELIQSTIRTEFADCTVVTIAHRLNTIMDSDRVMVLDKGKVKEFNTPMALIQDSSTVFYGMARDAGLV